MSSEETEARYRAVEQIEAQLRESIWRHFTVDYLPDGAVFRWYFTQPMLSGDYLKNRIIEKFVGAIDESLTPLQRSALRETTKLSAEVLLDGPDARSVMVEVMMNGRV